MLELLQIDGPDGIIPAWCVSLHLNADQQLKVIGVDFEMLGDIVEMDTPKGYEYHHLGKLSDQSFIFKSQIINSLAINEWPFEVCQDPEIILISKM